MKREMLAEAMSTALMETSFIMLLCLDYSSIYNRLLTNNTSTFLGNVRENGYLVMRWTTSRQRDYNILM